MEIIVVYFTITNEFQIKLQLLLKYSRYFEVYGLLIIIIHGKFGHPFAFVFDFGIELHLGPWKLETGSVFERDDLQDSSELVFVSAYSHHRFLATSGTAFEPAYVHFPFGLDVGPGYCLALEGRRNVR